jgi:hypothetical protein
VQDACRATLGIYHQELPGRCFRYSFGYFLAWFGVQQDGFRADWFRSLFRRGHWGAFGQAFCRYRVQ